MKVRVFILCGSLLLSTLVPAGAADIPDSATIRARNAAASGPLPTSYREVIHYVTGTLAGTQTIVRRGPDFRETDETTLGRTIAGLSKGDRWVQNLNGHTVIIEPDPGLATGETFTTTVAFITEPTDVYRVSTLNARGFGTIDDYDPVSWMLVRRENKGATGSAITTYDAFQTFGSRTMATHWHIHDERTRRDSDYTVESFAAAEIADADVAIVDNRRELVEFPNGVTHVELPATFLPNGHIIVPVKIGERSYDFVLDTGAAGITIDPAIAATMHFAIQNQYSNAANAGRIDSGTVVVPEMHVGDLVMHDVYTNTVPQGVEEADRVKTLGLLGFDFICELGITIDYAHKVVFADRYGSYQPLGHALQLPIRLGSFQPMTTVKVNGAIAERMLIDTGAAGATVLLFNYFARRHPEALVDDLGKGARSNPISFNGVGGGFATKPYAFNSLLIGNFNFHDFVGYVVTSRAYSGTQDGLIGSGFLQFFTVQLDYPNGVIYLEPNEKLKAAL